MSESKRCSKCGEVKAVEEFRKNSQRKDDLECQCRPCCKESRALKKLKHPERFAKRHDAWRQVRQLRKLIEPASTGEKRCVNCTQVKDIEEFYIDRGNNDGRMTECKTCTKARIASYRHANVDLHRDRSRAYQKAHREEILERLRQKNALDPTKNRARAAAWNKANPGRVKERTRQWNRDNPGKAQAVKERRRARVDGAEGSYTTAEWESLLDAIGRVCLRCGIPEVESICAFRTSGIVRGRLTIDHVIPVSKNGSNNISNLQALCQPCQLWKRDKPVDFRPLHVRKMFSA